MGRCIFQIFCILIIQMCFSPHGTSSTEEYNPDCIPTIRVPRNTVWKAPEMSELVINCTVESRSPCWKTVEVSWCRLDDMNQCRPLHNSNHTKTWEYINESTRLLFLIFHNISMQDAGLYRCSIKSSVSHSINVTVTDYVPENDTSLHEVVRQGTSATNSTNLHGENKDSLQFYIYIYSGIGVLLIIVVVVFVTVIRCRAGQKKSIKEKIQETQSTATPVTDVAPPRYNPRASPHNKTQTLPAQLSSPPPANYDTLPVRGMSLRDRSSAGRHPVNRGPPGQCHNRVTVKEVQEENPLIYATLNHEVLPPRPVRVAYVQIEASEYAAIKVT